MDTTHNTPPPLPAHNTPSPVPSEQHAPPSPGLSYATDPEDNMDVAPLNNQAEPDLAGPEVDAEYILIKCLILTANIAL